MNLKSYSFIAAGLAVILFASCTKFYKCECTDYMGVKTTHTVTAKTKNDANKNCAEIQTLGNCQLK